MTEIEGIYERYFKDVYRYALSLCKNEFVAEEITQETFFKALKSIDRFRGECKIPVWLCQIAKSTYFSSVEKEKRLASTGAGAGANSDRQTHLAEPPGSQPRDDISDLEQRCFDRERAFEIHTALHKLEEPYKEVFSLRVFGELPFKQIAQLFGKTESWARVTYHRAKLMIREGLL